MRRTRWWTFGSSFVLALLLLALALPRPSEAQSTRQIRDKFRTGDTVVIAASESVPHDLYVAGGTVRIEGRIDGDLFVGGGTIDLSGPVTGDLYVGGGNVSISGPVSGDVFVAGGSVSVTGSVGRHLRVAGGDVTVGGPVQSDVLAGAGTINVRSGTKIGGDLIFGAGQAALGGAVGGGVLGSAEAYTRTGTVAGSEDVTINTPQPREAPARRASSGVLDQVRRYVAIVVLGALLLLVPPRLVQAGATRLRERPLPSLGFGALAFVGFFAVMLGLFIGMLVLAVPLGILGFGQLAATVVIGVLLGSAVLSYAFFLVLAFLAAAVVGLLVGQYALERLSPGAPANPYVALLLGVLVVVAVTAIPVVGGLVSVVVALLGLGALVLRFWPQGGRTVVVAPPLVDAPTG